MNWGILDNYYKNNNMLNAIMQYNMFQMFMNLYTPACPQQSIFCYNSYPNSTPSIFCCAPNIQYFNNATYDNLINNLKSEYSLDDNTNPFRDIFGEGTKEDEVANKEIGKKSKNVKYDKKFKNKGKLGKDFLNRVKKMAKSLNCDYKDLLAVINCESSFNTRAKNPGGAVGLTQFTDAAIAELKRVYGIVVTKEQILNMSALEQLDLAEKYLLIAKSYTFDKNARLSADDLYALNFLPGRANREVLCEKGERDKNGRLLGYYEGHGNSGLDKNKDNKITKSELGERVRNKYVDESLFA